jgi:hypothetical protein
MSVSRPPFPPSPPARLPSRLNGRPWFMEREKFFNDFLARAREGENRCISPPND